MARDPYEQRVSAASMTPSRYYRINMSEENEESSKLSYFYVLNNFVECTYVRNHLDAQYRSTSYNRL